METILKYHDEMPLLEKLMRGEGVVKEIVGDIIYDQMEISTPMKLFFSMIQPTSWQLEKAFAKEFIKRLGTQAKLGANGLLIKDGKVSHLYPFTPEYEEIIHRNVLRLLIHEAEDIDSAFNLLQSIHQQWQRYYISIIQNRMDEELYRDDQKALVDLRKEFHSHFIGHTRADYLPLFFNNVFPGIKLSAIKEIKKLIEEHEKRLNEERSTFKEAYYKEVSKNISDTQEEFYKTQEERLAKLNKDEKEKLMNLQSRKIRGFKVRKDARKKIIEAYERKRNSIENQKGVYRKWLTKEENDILQRELEELSTTRIQELESLISSSYNISFDYYNFKDGTEKLFIEAFENHLIDSGQMSRAEIDEYNAFSFNNRNWAERIHNIYLHKHGRSKGRIAIIQGVLQRIQYMIRQTCMHDYLSSFKRDPWYRIHPNKFLIRRDDYPTPIEIEAMIDSLMETLGINRKEVQPIIDEYTDYCKNYFNNLMIRYQEGYQIWGKISPLEVTRLWNAKREMRKDLHDSFKARVKKRSIEDFERVMLKIVRQFTTRRSQISHLIMLPTGFIIGTPKTGFDITGFSPIDPKIKGILTKEEWIDWQQAWGKFYEKSINLFDATVRRFVNLDINDQLTTDPTVLKDYETRLIEMQEEYHLKRLDVFEEKAGQFILPITAKAVSSLEKFLPIYGRFFDKITTTFNPITVKDLTLSIKNFMSGEDNNLCNLISGDIHSLRLNISSLEALLTEVDDNMEELNPYIISAIATRVYVGLDPSIIKEFNELVRSSIEISKLSFFRFSGKRIDSPIERCSYMSRILFMMEFSKYFSREQNGEMLEFMKKIDTRL